MKAILKYDLPEDQSDYFRAVHSLDIVMALWDYSQYLRGIEKYQDETPDIEELRKRFYDILDDNNINLDKLIQ